MSEESLGIGGKWIHINHIVRATCENMEAIEAPRSPRRASTANRQNHWRQPEPVGNALTFAVQRRIQE
jgi:hypothetical protein